MIDSIAIPDPVDDDDEDVHWALSTASALWGRGEAAEALKWLRRAADTASDANADDRALHLYKAAADVASKMDAMSAAGQAVRPPAPPSVPAPPSAPAPASFPAPAIPLVTRSAAPPPPAPPSIPRAAPSVPRSPPAAPSVPRSAAPSVRPASAALDSPVPSRPSAPRSLPEPQPPEAPASPRVSVPIHRMPQRIAPAAPFEAPSEPRRPPSVPAPSARPSRPLPSEVDTIRRERPNLTSNTPTARPPAGAMFVPAPKSGSGLRGPADDAPDSGQPASSKPNVGWPTSIKRRSYAPDDEVTVQRDISAIAAFNDLDEETSVLSNREEAIAAGLVEDDEDDDAAHDEATDDDTPSRTSPDIHTGLSEQEAMEALQDLRAQRPRIDLAPSRPAIPSPMPSSVRRSEPATVTAIRVAVLGRGPDGRLDVVTLGAEAAPPKGAAVAILVASTPEDSDALRRFCDEP